MQFCAIHIFQDHCYLSHVNYPIDYASLTALTHEAGDGNPFAFLSLALFFRSLSDKTRFMHRRVHVWVYNNCVAL